MDTFYFELESQEQFDNLINSSKICVIDFYASWCGPCKSLSNLLSSAVKKDNILSLKHKNNLSKYDNMNDGIVFIKVNVDKFSKLVDIFNVSSIPYVVFYKYGKLQEKIINGADYIEIINIINELL